MMIKDVVIWDNTVAWRKHLTPTKKCLFVIFCRKSCLLTSDIGGNDSIFFFNFCDVRFHAPIPVPCPWF